MYFTAGSLEVLKSSQIYPWPARTQLRRAIAVDSGHEVGIHSHLRVEEVEANVWVVVMGSKVLR